MNYLAHIFLSGKDEEMLIGNFIGDYVKGRNYMDFESGIRSGIVLHRRIDAFTDTHRVVHQSKQYLLSHYDKYSGIIIDLFYDHFLIKNWHKFSPYTLEEFKEWVFEVLMKFYPLLPERVQFFIPSFIKNDWIDTYSTKDGIINVIYRLSMRTTLPNESEFAAEILRKYYTQFDSEFMTFFPEILSYVIENFEAEIDLVNRNILKQ